MLISCVVYGILCDYTSLFLFPYRENLKNSSQVNCFHELQTKEGETQFLNAAFNYNVRESFLEVVEGFALELDARLEL